MAVQDNGTRIQYTATASQTVFPYPFEILDEDDITVVQNSTTLSKTTHYTVSGVGSDTGGNITFVTGATSGDVITIYRSMALSRVTNYQANAAFLESEVDADFDRLWMAQQQTSSDATRGIRASQTDSILNSTNTELAIPATRAGKVLGFDSTGALSYYASTVASADFIQVTTTAAMAALASPTVGDVVQTAEFSTGNGGGGTYDCVTVGTTANVDLPNTYNIIVSTVDATKCFVLRVESILDARSVGCSVAAVDNKASAEAASAISSLVIFPSLTGESYTFSAAPTLTSGVTFLFDRGGAFSGATAEELNAIITDTGVVQGYASSPELKDGKIEIVSGTIRQQQPTSVTGITRPSGTSAIVNEVAHGRVVGDWVVIQGASPTGYNGTHEIAQIDDVDNYRVVVDSGLASPATGTITVFGADVWEWIKDSTHEPLGVDDSTPVRSDGSGYGLLVPFLKTYSKVLSMNVGPDETIAGAQGMVIGASVSTSAIAFRASLNKTVAGRVLYDGADWAVNMGTDQGTIYTNDAPYPFSDINYTGGNLTLNHSFCLGSDIKLTPNSAGGTATPFIPVLKSNTDDEAVINFLHVNAGALALYTGAASTQLSFQFTKNSNRLIKFDGSDRSSEAKMYFGNIWFFGIMQV
jgi:hypothetical protein